MNKLNPFFVIGTTGLIVIAALHMLMSLVFKQHNVHGVFLGVYPAFIGFLTIGIMQMRRAKATAYQLQQVKKPASK